MSEALGPVQESVSSFERPSTLSPFVYGFTISGSYTLFGTFVVHPLNPLNSETLVDEKVIFLITFFFERSVLGSE